MAKTSAHGEEYTMELVVCWELPPVVDPYLRSLFQRDCNPYYRHNVEQFLKNCSLWEAHIGSVWEGVHPMGGTPWWSLEETEEEWQRRSVMD